MLLHLNAVCCMKLQCALELREAAKRANITNILINTNADKKNDDETTIKR